MIIEFGSRYDKPNSALCDAYLIREALIQEMVIEATHIENICDGHLEEYSPGIYLTNAEVPLIGPVVKNYKVYPEDKKIYVVDDLTDDIDVILDLNGNIIIDKNHIRNKKYLLHNKPSIPVRGLEILVAAIYKLIDTNNPFSNLLYKDNLNPDVNLMFVPDYTKTLTGYDDVLRILLERPLPDNKLNAVINIIENSLVQFDKFISDMPTYIYHVIQEGTSITLGRSVDIRAFRYDLIAEAKEECDYA